MGGRWRGSSFSPITNRHSSFLALPVSREFLVESAIKGEFLIIIVQDIHVVIFIIAKNLGKMEYLIQSMSIRELNRI